MYIIRTIHVRFFFNICYCLMDVDWRYYVAHPELVYIPGFDNLRKIRWAVVQKQTCGDEVEIER